MRYRVVGILGRGSSAVVELAVADDGTSVARKRLTINGSAREMDVARRRLRREAEILAGLNHPGIVPVLAVEDDGADLVVVMPALPASLADRVAGYGPLGTAEVVGAARRLLGALAAAHRGGVVHRDIKPANVLVDHAGRLALADFGAAWRESTAGLTATGTVVGTPRWLSPEQARGERAGPAADVFAVAATLMWAATGVAPWGEGHPAAMVARAARGDVAPFPTGMDGRLRSLFAPMLRAMPGERPTAVEALALLDAIAGSDTSAHDPAGSDTAGSDTTGRAGAYGTARDTERVGVGPRIQPPGPDAHGEGPAHRGRRVRRVLLGADGHRAGRRARTAAAVTGGGALVLGGAVTALVATGASPASPAEATPAPAACIVRPYEPCGQPPAPHTDGTSCLPGWYDLDRSAADGCEAHSDWTAGTVLGTDASVHANVVPATAVDTFTTRVSGHLWSVCSGSVDLRLLAPAGAADRLDVLVGGRSIGSAVSAGGQAASVEVSKPGCFGDHSETLTLQVRTVAGDSPSDFSLSRTGGW